MNLEPTDEQRAVAAVLREIAEDVIRPAARACEEAGRPSEEVGAPLRAMGVAVPVPEPFGGQGTFDALTSVMVAEEIASGDPGVAFGVLGEGLAATIVDLAGSPAQRSALLPGMVGTGGALLLAERDAGADVSAVEAHVTAGPGDAVLIGTKYTVVGLEAGGPRLVVVRSTAGPAIRVLPPAADLIAQPEDKLGLRSARTWKVVLDGTAAGEPLGDGDAARTRLALLRASLLHAGVALGLARAALAYATDYAKERTAFGRPIGAFQAISFRIADRAMDLDAARLLAWKAACGVDDAVESGAPAAAVTEAERAVATACGHAVAAAAATADDAVQVLGGHGYMRDHPVELWYRDALTLAALHSPVMVGDLLLAQAFIPGETGP